MTETPTEPELTVYRERAYLVAYLARVYFSHWSRDIYEPEYPVICIHTPVGQMTWHIAKADVELLPAGLGPGEDWDGHSTEEKYARLAALSPTFPREVHDLIAAARAIRDGRAETTNPARRDELWRNLANAADLAAVAIESGPFAAAVARAERALREREAARG